MKNIIKVNANVERSWFSVYEVFADGELDSRLNPYQYVLVSEDVVLPLYRNIDEYIAIEGEPLKRYFEKVATIYGFDDNVELYTPFVELMSTDEFNELRGGV